MKFTTDKIQWTDSMKDFAEMTLAKKLDRLVEDISICDLKVSRLNDDIVKVEISMPNFRAQAVHSDFYAAMVEAASKLKSIISRNRSKKKRHETSDPHQISIFDIVDEMDEVEDEDSTYLKMISKEKVFNLTPMTLEDAINMFECTDYPFFVYKDIDDDNNIAVIYKRFGNTLGIIRCY